MKDQETVTVKRNINVKAVVTEKLKEDMKKAIVQAVADNKKQLETINKKISEVTSVVFDGQIMPGNTIHQQLEAERQKIMAQANELAKQAQLVRDIPIGGEIQHQPLEGMVEIKEGDNLYEKISGLEMIIKDGIIQKISKIRQPVTISGTTPKPISPQLN